MERKEENDKGVAGAEEADRKHEEWNTGASRNFARAIW